MTGAGDRPSGETCICGRGVEFIDGHAAFCTLPVITERNGLQIGDRVSIGDVWFTVAGFAGSECDVVLRRWHTETLETFCMRQREFVKADQQPSEAPRCAGRVAVAHEPTCMVPTIDGWRCPTCGEQFDA